MTCDDALPSRVGKQRLRSSVARVADVPERLSVVRANIDDPTDLMRDLERALTGGGPPVAPISADSVPNAGSGSIDPLPPALRRALAPEAPLESPKVAVVLPTSGSTGEPKGVSLSAEALTASAEATLTRLGGPGRWLLALPPSRIAGLMVLIRSVLGGAGAPVPLSAGVPEADSARSGAAAGSGQAGFDPYAFAAATRVLMTSPSTGDDSGRYYTSLVPTQLLRLLDTGGEAADALRAYDAVLVGGAAANETLLRRARDAGVAVVTTYGATETCGGCVYDGTALDGVAVSLQSDGRILIGGDVLFSGYRLDPEETARARVDGWFRTADLGRIDEQGRLAVLGRTDDVVISGGVNVPLPAVEEAVSAMSNVSTCAVTGVPDPVWGSKVVAFVVPRPGVDAPALSELRDAVSALYPREYAPRKVVVLPDLPVLESGKVDRLRLRSLLH